jgi:hypothetical protein
MFARLVVALAFSAVIACAASKRDPRYPRRAPGCPLAIYHTPTPQVMVWDDLGVAEVSCYLDESEITCLHRLRTEACRMGGDIIYNVPKRALRPHERGMVYRGRVAHTREPPPKPADDTHAEANAHPADAGAGAGPIVPLPSVVDMSDKPAPADGGAD